MGPNSTRYVFETHAALGKKPLITTVETSSDVLVSRTVKQKTEKGHSERVVIFSRVRAENLDNIRQWQADGKFNTNEKTIRHVKDLLKSIGTPGKQIDCVLPLISLKDDSAELRRAKELRHMMMRIQADEFGGTSMNPPEPTQDLRKQPPEATTTAVKSKSREASPKKVATHLSANLFEDVIGKPLIDRGALQKTPPPLPAAPKN
jgi:hypothetical protein